MKYKIGDKVTYDTPLSGGGEYEVEILGIGDGNIYRVKILKIIRPSRNPIAPQKVGDIDYVFLSLLARSLSLYDMRRG